MVSPRQPYTPLWCKSVFSFLEGASQPEELVEAAAAYGLPALALTDRDGVYGIVRAHVAARAHGLGLIVGSQVTLADRSQIVLLCQDRAGYAHLCQLITLGRRRSPKGQSSVTWDEVCAHAGGLVALWGGPDALIAHPHVDPRPIGERLRRAFGDALYATVARHELPGDDGREARTRARAAALDLPVVAAQEVLYHSRARRPLQDVLSCIRHGVTLDDAGRAIRGNDAFALLNPRAAARLYADDPAALDRTREIAARCTFRLDELSYRYPVDALPDGRDARAWLRSLAYRGLHERFSGRLGGARLWQQYSQVARELHVVEELRYEGYFLTMHELVQFCRRQDILCQGRGSAANSTLCYALGITAVDPTQVDLLFERFLSKERAEPPDIDLDIEHTRREEVIQYVYERYGRTHAAMVANVIRYRLKSAIRDVGKALGLPAVALDKLAKLCGHHDRWGPELLQAAGFDPAAPRMDHLLALVAEIQDVPRHLSIHPGGFLLGHEPVATLVPIENATMDGRTVIQWDKDDVEDAGLFKVDLLGLGALTQLHCCFDLLRRHEGRTLDLATLPREDPATFDMICAGDTLGTFQIESRAQMAMVRRLKPRNYYDLVIEISIVRPGPITGGMVHPYLRRRCGQEPVTYPHACLRPVLQKTLGVPLFQEQVMRLAVVAADYSPGEADQLRRDMAAWRKRGRIDRHRQRLIRAMTAKGIDQEFAERIFEQIRGFGEYGFPESHAASFAHIAYATAYLRCHHPAAFICALLNAQPMGFYSPASIVQDAVRMGLELRPIDLGRSRWDCTLEPLPDGAPARGRWAVRMGLRMVKGLRPADGAAVEAAAEARPFTDVFDVARRTGLPRDKLLKLAQAGAFGGLGLSRRDALWQLHRWVPERQGVLPLVEREPSPGFQPLQPLETIAWDLNAARHSTRGHLLQPLRATLSARGLPTARQVAAMADGARLDYVGLAICRQRPSTAAGVVFMTLEDETGFVNLVVWQRVWRRYATLAKTVPCLGVRGRLQVDDGVVHLVAQRFWQPDFTPAPGQVQSRDFR